MLVTQFLLFVIAVLLLAIFWVLSKINSNLKKDSAYRRVQVYEKAKKEYGQSAA